MSYKALYRVWRPQTFADVIGQTQTVTTLRNAVIKKQLAHAYILAGPRGTGKTSIAKILARAANCNNLQAGEPCNQCVSCLEILQGTFMDVVEIDAASNRGIDEIRDLREQVRIMPAQGKRKVYIIDEVHMLTTEAFNALLKTLEEPPETVMFILATTNVHKLPDTIISRCQKFNLLPLTREQIRSRLEQVTQQDSIQIAAAALDLIARRADGGMRDALGILEQLYAYQGDQISVDNVLEITGLVDEQFVSELISAIFAQQPTIIIEKLSLLRQQGKSPRLFLQEMAKFIRDLLVYQLLGEKADFSFSLPPVKQVYSKYPIVCSQNILLAALQKIITLDDKLRFEEDQHFLLEVACLNLSHSLQQPSVQPAPPKSKESVPAAVSPPAAAAVEAPVELENQQLWKKLLEQVKTHRVTTHALLSQGHLWGIKDHTVYISYKSGYRFHKEKIEEPDNRAIVETALHAIDSRPLKPVFLFIDEEQENDLVVQKAIEWFGEDKVEIKD